MRTLHRWLAVQDSLPSATVDAVIGFGHFDLSVPRHCLNLFRWGYAKQIIFSGGIGAGTADLGGAEADVFEQLVYRLAPCLADSILVENRSTNTAENIRFTGDMLELEHPGLAFGKGIRSVILVATPCRQRRVWQTWRKLQPEVISLNSPPAVPIELLSHLYTTKGEDLSAQLLGEYERLRDYPARGWVVDDPIPARIDRAAATLMTATAVRPTGT